MNLRSVSTDALIAELVERNNLIQQAQETINKLGGGPAVRSALTVFMENKGKTYAPSHYLSCEDRIVLVVQEFSKKNNRTMSRSEIHDAMNKAASVGGRAIKYNSNYIDTTLSSMVRKGVLTRPSIGCYSLPK